MDAFNVPPSKNHIIRIQYRDWIFMHFMTAKVRFKLVGEKIIVLICADRNNKKKNGRQGKNTKSVLNYCKSTFSIFIF